MNRPSPILAQARTLLARGERDQARATLAHHLARVPGDHDAAKILASLYLASNQHALAASLLEQTTKVHKRDPHLLYLLGQAALALGQSARAADAFAASIQIEPREPLPHHGLAQALLAQGDLTAAIAAATRPTKESPQHPDAWFGLTTLHAQVGDFPAAIAAAREGLSHAPHDLQLLQAAVYALNVLDTPDERELTDLHRRLGRAVATTFPRDPRSFSSARDPAKRLKLGFVSADLRTHSVAFFLEGLIPAFDRDRLALTLYSLTAEHDEVTGRFKSLATFRDLYPLTDSQRQQLVTSDAPDILIDLSGWTSRASMTLLAPRLAPIQGTYLGYPNTTGLPSIDFRLVDALTDPPGPAADATATERLARLPRCFLAFQPGNAWPEPRPQPSSDRHPFTFCSFNNLTKLSPATIRTWKHVLDRVPNSRLLLKSPRVPQELLDHHTRALIAAGIPAHRLTLHPYISDLAEHVALYNQADIALDPFPYNGTTTTCEALWMGVPVITLAGGSHRARVGVSLLTTIGHPDLIAHSEDDYAAKAADLAASPDRLARLHATLRDDMRASDLVNANTLARAIEAALREEWQRFCNT